MKLDDSFKQPGSVPFKWEIRPGVPKLQNPQKQIPHRHHEPDPQSEHHQQFEPGHQAPVENKHNNNSYPKTRPKLSPPPAGFHFHPPPEPRTHSFRSSPRTSSRRLGMPGLARPEIVSVGGCFPSPRVKIKHAKRTDSPRSRFDTEYGSDPDTPPRWSVSSRRSVSPLSSSFASHQSSPRPVNDAEWGAFGLF